MIRAITFDLDGVYFPDGKGNFINALGGLGVSESEARRVFLKSKEMNELYKIGTMTDDEYWTWAASEWKLDITPEALIQLLLQGYDIDENVVSAVKTVRENGYKTLICSNNFPARVNGLQGKFHFLDNFDVHVFSYEIGAAKPSEIIFSELIGRANVPAESIIFADDSPENLEGAKKLGITTFLYQGFDAFVRELQKAGVKI